MFGDAFPPPPRLFIRSERESAQCEYATLERAPLSGTVGLPGTHLLALLIRRFLLGLASAVNNPHSRLVMLIEFCLKKNRQQLEMSGIA